MSALILLTPHRTELIEKQSRFIAAVFPCPSLEVFKARKAELELEFPDASHITFAYTIQEHGQFIQRFSDAGEPSGTAGKPILMHLTGRHVMNAALFVVRYFGGTKLGAGGLVRAYGAAARSVLDTAELIPFVAMCELDLSVPYAAQTQLDYSLRKHQGIFLSREFGAQLSCRVQLPEHEKLAFLATLGRSTTQKTKD